MKSKKIKSLLAATFIMVSIISVLPEKVGARNPVGYASLVEIRQENGKTYVYSFCLGDEGNSCNIPGSIHRFEASSIFGDN